ncbi:hypothetical protein ColLi_13926 [Colletotrichum liriopes]|uniref:Uncharacterized protein n=1 Tax=Colletotrichum liriopes TaxID=708192 RepID=A0AA37H3X9_9PEZI|nr:hypothetical protein ColLi_13926 [Colletotrichum liriopes]
MNDGNSLPVSDSGFAVPASDPAPPLNPLLSRSRRRRPAPTPSPTSVLLQTIIFLEVHNLTDFGASRTVLKRATHCSGNSGSSDFSEERLITRA